MSMKILLACSSEAETSLIDSMLNEYKVITAGDGLEVLQLLGMNRDIKLVLSDLNLPNVNGFELLNFIKSQEIYKDLRILILSDSNTAEDEIRCLNLGAHDYIRKPNQMLSLQNRVKNQLDILYRQSKYADSEQAMKSIFEQAPIGIAVYCDGACEGVCSQLAVNSEFERIFGENQDELVQKGKSCLTHLCDLQGDPEQFKMLQSGEIKSYSSDKRFTKPDGSFVWVHMVIAALDFADRNERKLICLVQDITEQKLAQMQIEKERKIFSTFMDSGQDIVSLKDENFRYVFINKAAQAFRIKNKKMLIGKQDFEILDAESASNCRTSDQDAIEKNKAVTSIGTIGDRIYEIRKFPVDIGDGKTGVGAFTRDITAECDRQEILNKIAETNKIITLCMLKPFSGIQEQLDYALNEALKVTGSKYGYIYLYNETTQEFTLNSWTSGVMPDCTVADQKTKSHMQNTGLWGEVVRQRKPMIVNDYKAENSHKKGLPGGHVQIENFMSIPIFENDKIVAVVGFANRKGDFTENDVYTMTVLMSGVWIATKKREKEIETEILLERSQSMFNNHEVVMLLLEPLTGQIIEANNAAVKFYGYTKQELLAMKIQSIHVAEEEKVLEYLLRALNQEQNCFTVTHRLKNGETRVVDIFNSTIEYNRKKVLFPIIFDVTARETMTKQNEYLVYHDYLTEAYNRRYFDEEFNRRSSIPDQTYPIGIIWGDINGFKMYNDSFGHLEGDRALKNITDKIKQCTENGDVLARVGGDEFAILVSNTDEDKIRAYLNKIEWEVNHSTDNALTISFGYGIQRKQLDTMDVLVKEAEAFMYNRKYYSSKSSRSNAVKVIMETLFAKSEREKYHSERVGLISEAIAKAMDLDQETIDKIRVSGFLHDIGKIGIEENILNKVGILSKSEWEIMKLHPAKGAGILENTVEFQDIADCVLSHHERYDGTGYPNRLKGEGIPLVSRIISVADAYDAMTNDRSYRNKIDHMTAVEELKQCAGTHFDPMIVEKFTGISLFDIKRLGSDS